MDAVITHVLYSPMHDHSLLIVHISRLHSYVLATGRTLFHKAPFSATEPERSAHAGNTTVLPRFELLFPVCLPLNAHHGANTLA